MALMAALKLHTHAAHRQQQKKIHAENLTRVTVGQLAFGVVVLADSCLVVEQHSTDRQIVKCRFAYVTNRVHDIDAINLIEIFELLRQP